MIFIGLLIGLFIGGCAGVVVMALVQIGREERKREEKDDGLHD